MYLLVDLVTPAHGAVVDGVDGALVIPGQLGRMKRQVGLHGLVKSVSQTLKIRMKKRSNESFSTSIIMN